MSNIEAAARAIAAEICRNHPLPGADNDAWIDRHWEAVAAELEAGLIDEQGEPLPGYGAEGLGGLARLVRAAFRRAASARPVTGLVCRDP